MLRLLGQAAVMSSVFVSIIVACQDLLIFPGVISALYTPAPLPPEGVKAFTVDAADGVRLQMWEVAATSDPSALNQKPRPLVFFHGNGGTMANFFGTQLWLAGLGFQAYAIDTRGFGGSQGWPSERGMEMDAEAAVEGVAAREHVRPEDVAIAGLSLGTGLAAYAAAKFGVRSLILISPYSNLRVRASEDPLLGFLSPFLKYEIPTSDYVSRLDRTCLVLAHGSRDAIINEYHSDVIARAYKGKFPLQSVRVPEAGHNDLLALHSGIIGEAIQRCSRETE